MVLSIYTPGDLVVSKRAFGKCGCVVSAQGDRCLVRTDGQSVSISDNELLLLSVRNIPNLRLAAEKVWQAQATVSADASIGHSVMAYLSSGTVVSRAFADYVLKIAPDILAECLREMDRIGCNAEKAVELVLGLNFDLVSGRP